MARPKLPIDENLVEKLAKVGCSNESIAIQAGCSVDTLTRRYADLLAKSRENLKTQLRIWQIEAARKGSNAMLIWLGKQMLGQTEKIEQNTTAKIETLSPAEVKEIIAKDPFLNGHARADQSTKNPN